jgi:hypothetical protein
VIESITGARFVHDTLEEQGWDVLVADAGFSRKVCSLRHAELGFGVALGHA